MVKRKIAVFTGNRSEYGLLFPVIQAIAQHPQLILQLIVSGSHLDSHFGETITEIQQEACEIAAQLKLVFGETERTRVPVAIGSGIQQMASILEELNSTCLVVFGDRFEAFSAAVAAATMNVPVVHIEGGDITQGGCWDDNLRHAITKLAHLHLTSHAAASERVIRLGEEPWRVHTVGFSPLDRIKKGDFASVEAVVQKFQINLDKPLILFTQHPVSTQYEVIDQQITPSIEALRFFAKEGYQVIITYPNNDTGGQSIISSLQRFAAELDVPHVQLHASLGRHCYHGVLNVCGQYRGVCMGNSSSGLLEAPAFFCPTVNIGERQAGRLQAGNVLSVAHDKTVIITAVQTALWDEDFRTQCHHIQNPYGDGDTGTIVAKLLAEQAFDIKFLQKKMTY